MFFKKVHVNPTNYHMSIRLLMVVCLVGANGRMLSMVLEESEE